jgi:acyl-CoA thioesterase
MSGISRGFDPFATHLGINYESVQDGVCRVSLVPKEEHFNPVHYLSGGVIYTMIDHGMGAALWSVNPEGITATIEIKINYLNPVKEPKKLIGEIRIVEKRTKIAYLEGEVKTEDGTLIAKATGTFFIIR